MDVPRLADGPWEVVGPLLPPRRAQPTGGRPFADDRAARCGILFVLRTGAPWPGAPRKRPDRVDERAPDGLPQVSTFTVLRVLRGAGPSWQRDRTWCDTGAAVRQRQSGAVVAHDPDALAKKT